MSSALPKLANDKDIAEYMENLSINYFSQIFPNSTISIEPKAKVGKQGGHIIVIKSNETNSKDPIVKVRLNYNHITTLNFLPTLIKKLKNHFF
jgi:hypothetical protein